MEESYRRELEALNNRFPEKDCLRVEDLAAYLGVCTKTVYRMVADRKFPKRKIRGSIIITKSALARFLAS